MRWGIGVTLLLLAWTTRAYGQDMTLNKVEFQNKMQRIYESGTQSKVDEVVKEFEAVKLSGEQISLLLWRIESDNKIDTEQMMFLEATEKIIRQQIQRYHSFDSELKKRSLAATAKIANYQEIIADRNDGIRQRQIAKGPLKNRSPFLVICDRVLALF